MIGDLLILAWLLSLCFGYVVYKDAQTNPNTQRSPTFWFVVVGFFPVFGLLMYLIEAWEGGGVAAADGGMTSTQKTVRVRVAGKVQKSNGEKTEVEMKINTNDVYEATTLFRDSCVNKGYEPVGNPTITLDSVQQ